MDPLWHQVLRHKLGTYDYDDAKAYCAAHGGKLASIATEGEFNAVATAVSEYVW